MCLSAVPLNFCLPTHFVSHYYCILFPRGRAFLVSIKNRDLCPDFLCMRRVFFSFCFSESGLSDRESQTSGVGSRFLVLTKKSEASGDQNNWTLRTEKRKNRLSTRSQVNYNTIYAWLVSVPLRRLYMNLTDCFVYRCLCWFPGGGVLPTGNYALKG